MAEIYKRDLPSFLCVLGHHEVPGMFVIIYYSDELEVADGLHEPVQQFHPGVRGDFVRFSMFYDSLYGVAWDEFLQDQADLATDHISLANRQGQLEEPTTIELGGIASVQADLLDPLICSRLARVETLGIVCGRKSILVTSINPDVQGVEDLSHTLLPVHEAQHHLGQAVVAASDLLGDYQVMLNLVLGRSFVPWFPWRVRKVLGDDAFRCVVTKRPRVRIPLLRIWVVISVAIVEGRRGVVWLNFEVRTSHIRQRRGLKAGTW